jgi:hypothetical protein
MFLFLSFFSSTGGQNRSCPWGRIGTSGRGEVVGKGGRRVNTVQKTCAHACNCNNDTCCNYSMNGGRGIKDSSGRSEFKYGIVDTL